RHAQFDYVGAAGDQRVEDRAGIRRGRIAAGDEGDQRRASLGKGGGQAGGHSFTPSASATVKMSLSPRPDRLTMITLSLPSAGASRSATTRACADSSAGMIPSSRHSRWNEASASASVAGS